MPLPYSAPLVVARPNADAECHTVARSSDYFTSSISPGFHVLANHASSGPYSRKIVNQPLPGTVRIQLASLPAGALGPKQKSIEPSALVISLSRLLFLLGNGCEVCSSERVCGS